MVWDCGQGDSKKRIIFQFGAGLTHVGKRFDPPVGSNDVPLGGVEQPPGHCWTTVRGQGGGWGYAIRQLIAIYIRTRGRGVALPGIMLPFIIVFNQRRIKIPPRVASQESHELAHGSRGAISNF